MECLVEGCTKKANGPFCANHWGSVSKWNADRIYRYHRLGDEPNLHAAIDDAKQEIRKNTAPHAE